MYIPGSSRYVNFLPFGSFSLVKRHNICTLGRSRYIHNWLIICMHLFWTWFNVIYDVHESRYCIVQIFYISLILCFLCFFVHHIISFHTIMFFDSCTIICIIAIYCLYRVSTVFLLEFVLYRLFLYTSTVVTASLGCSCSSFLWM